MGALLSESFSTHTEGNTFANTVANTSTAVKSTVCVGAGGAVRRLESRVEAALCNTW